MKTIAFVLTLITLFCNQIAYSSDDFDKVYHTRVENYPIELSLLNGNIQVINIYKVQIKSIYETRNMVEADRINRFVKDVFFPYQQFWNNFFNEGSFRTWTKENWSKLQDTKSPGFLIPFEVDFDSLFTTTVGKLNILTYKKPQGKWYLVYGNKASGIGGFSHGDMFADFFGIGKQGVDHLVFSLPHEINHQLFGKSNAGAYTLLYRIIDEGLACYANYLYWDKKFSPAKNIRFTEKEWKWCVDHENTIFNYAKHFLDSTNSKIINKFSSAHSYILDGAPDRIAYFIGFRICEAYVKKNGEDSWRDIYSMHLIDILRLSGYENNIHD